MFLMLNNIIVTYVVLERIQFHKRQSNIHEGYYNRMQQHTYTCKRFVSRIMFPKVDQRVRRYIGRYCFFLNSSATLGPGVLPGRLSMHSMELLL